jgi:type II secretory pathway pseudopilin PulG
MKVSIRNLPVRSRLAFTLAEIMVVMAIFTMLVLALVSCQLFGMRMYNISQTKLAATADGRKALNQIRERIRQGKIVLIGMGDATTFTNIQDNDPQVGNALQIYPTTNLNIYTRYYLDPVDRNLKGISSGGTVPDVVARFVTNSMVFQAEDFRGNILTNDDNNRVIKMTLEFYRWEYPLALSASDADHTATDRVRDFSCVFRFSFGNGIPAVTRCSPRWFFSASCSRCWRASPS